MDSGANGYSENIRRAITALQNGEMILLFDLEGREAETDFTIPAMAVKPSDVRWMRKDAGGLICVALDPDASEELGLPLMADIIREANQQNISLGKVVEKGGDLKYDSRSSFSIWVNHRDTRTGIPDNDRALTINKLGEVVDKTLNGEEIHFGSEFRTPGHVATLRAAKGLVHERMGQTELSITLAKIAGITPAMVVCEMLDDDTGRALEKDDAKQYGIDNDIVFVEGEEVVEAYEIWLRSQTQKN
ncbi:3,4-dihydroxy-2-butanone-4-phosphate synthase [Methanolobus zinderi]|uniref:3,4-dihydroxy-2-butanone 4-phosphate synthase n=2 Tax=Methanolobus zinderi TaxID=536044 RepID=A0A7D5EIJ2_9EURY|nr:3,4-dihydroxy-2-butanone-4-phosphate synthase [Methanolobus zinderi]QLC51360.1 3,4-dihydroxy-2-butanone-4-phosphate synthase [Methanolobus zinderi]